MTISTISLYFSILVELGKKIEVNIVNIKIEENIETIVSHHDEIVKVEEVSVESDSEIITKNELARETNPVPKKAPEGSKKKKYVSSPLAVLF